MDGSLTPYLSERIEVRSDGCWIWTGEVRPDGYGTANIKRVKRRAHRVVYELLVGPIPDKLVLDHLCRVRACVNPEHLEPVTVGENVLRGETRSAAAKARNACEAGHEYTPESTYIRPSGHRDCRICGKLRAAKYRGPRKPKPLPRQCSVDGCSRKHSAKGYCDKHYRQSRTKAKVPRVQKPSSWPQEELDFAEYLLKDGASYREVSYTTGIPRTTLSDKFPGMGWTPAQGRAFIAWVARDDKRQAMFHELYDEKRRVY